MRWLPDYRVAVTEIIDDFDQRLAVFLVIPCCRGDSGTMFWRTAVLAFLTEADVMTVSLRPGLPADPITHALLAFFGKQRCQLRPDLCQWLWSGCLHANHKRTDWVRSASRGALKSCQ